MKDSISHLHVVCEDWMRELQFYKNEIPFFKKRIEELSTKYTAKDVLAQIEHFENKFHIMDTHCDELIHDVKAKNKWLLNQASEQPKFIGVKMIEAEENIPDLMEFTARDFASTKKEFYEFLSRYM